MGAESVISRIHWFSMGYLRFRFAAFAGYLFPMT
jgi:hypothetical protein